MRKSVRNKGLIFLLLVLLCFLVSGSEALANVGVRASADPFPYGDLIFEVVTADSAPYTATATAENGLNTAWASATMGNLKARAQVVSTGGLDFSNASAYFCDYFQISNPSKPANFLGNMIFNFILHGTMKVRADSTANYAKVAIGLRYDSVNYYEAGLDFGVLSFANRADLFAATDPYGGSFPQTNVLANPDGSTRVYKSITATDASNYRMVYFSIPVRFLIPDFRINPTSPYYPPEIFVEIVAGAARDAVSDFSATLAFSEQNPIIPDPADTRLPATGWTFTTGTSIELASPLEVETATGSGSAVFFSSPGMIENLVAVNENDMPEDGRPTAVFPHGFFDFDISIPENALSSTIELSLTLPGEVESGTRWYYVDGSDQWNAIDLGAGSDGRTIILTITDNGPMDNNSAEGVIHLSGGPGLLNPVATPAFDPDGGPHAGPSVQVTVSCATDDATIRYTTDGNEPTEASSAVASGGTVSVPVPGTLMAKAWKSGITPSATKSAAYTLSEPGTFALTLSFEGTGSVEITSDPAGINQVGTDPDSFTVHFEADSQVILFANPQPGTIFNNWGGDCAGASGDSCTLDMDADKNVIVNSMIEEIEEISSPSVSDDGSGGCFIGTVMDIE